MASAKAAQAFKAEGNAFFKAKEYEKAIEKYTEAISQDDTDVTFFSNRSACYAAIEEWQKAADDGRQCIILDKNFVKGYFRQAVGLKNSGQLEAASDSVKRGLGIESANKDLKNMSRELDEAMRVKKVETAFETAESQLKSGDVQAAYKTADGALRLDPTNQRLNKLMDNIRPKYEAAEKSRVAKLDPVARSKEQGDNCFREAKFEDAIKWYSKCIDNIKDEGNDLKLKCYANRAACYKQLSNFDGTIGDCTAVLEYKDNDVKALIRRAQAFEACERYKSAMQDARQVLALGQDVAGKASFDLANGMQHRLNRIIQQLRNG
jgi:stress-induced-phosphoprotein 1